MITEDTFKKLSMILFVGILVVLAFLTLQPLILTIILAMIFGYTLYPLYFWVLKYLKSENLSAFVVVLAFLLIIILPLWFLLPIIFKQIFNSYVFMQNADIAGILQSLFPQAATDSQANFSVAVNSFISTIVGMITKGFSNFLLNIPAFSFKLAVFLFVFFFAMRDSKTITKYIKQISPFNPSAEKKLTDQFRGITIAVIYGILVVGLVQGIITGIGLFIFGVPNALLLTVIAIFASMIPILGPWIVWIPAVIYLIATGNTFAGIGLLIYGTIIISWVDNYIRPKIVSSRSNLSTPVTFVGMIGGLMAFGILGLILGPLILSYLIIIIESYQSKVSLFNFKKQ